jgi:hypothetical protein
MGTGAGPRLEHLQVHPGQSWEKPELRDMKADPRTTIFALK